MINYIVVDDNGYILKSVKGIIDRVMMQNNLDYTINSFSDYDELFFKSLNKKDSNKIYILDIETKSASGIDIARRIRKNDVDSVIIFLTAHDELGSVVLKNQLMFLTFICKFDDYEKKLESAIKKALEVLNYKSVIRFKENNTLYTLNIKDILYIERDTIERKCIIKTDNANYRVNKNLFELKEMACGKLKQSHRACLVNPDRITSINKSTNKIEFDNGEVICLLSNNYKKELSEC